MQPQEEHKLIEACLNGNERAQRRLFDTHKADMFGVCLRYASNREEAHDMLQEGFVKVFKGLAKYQPMCPLKFWMKRVVINASLEYLRRNKKHQSANYEINEELTGVSLEVADKQGANELMELVQALPTNYRMVFNLYAIEGYTHKEIAEMMKIKESTSKVRLMRARALLQSKLKRQMSA